MKIIPLDNQKELAISAYKNRDNDTIEIKVRIMDNDTLEKSGFLIELSLEQLKGLLRNKKIPAKDPYPVLEIQNVFDRFYMERPPKYKER